MVTSSDVQTFIENQRKNTALTIADTSAQMCETLIELEKAQVFFPDAKAANWMMGEAGKVCLADTKSLLPINPQKKLQNYSEGFWHTRGFVPPDIETDKLNVSAYHAYEMGGNINNFINTTQYSTHHTREDITLLQKLEQIKTKLLIPDGYRRMSLGSAFNEIKKATITHALASNQISSSVQNQFNQVKKALNNLPVATQKEILSDLDKAAKATTSQSGVANFQQEINKCRKIIFLHQNGKAKEVDTIHKESLGNSSTADKLDTLYQETKNELFDNNFKDEIRQLRILGKTKEIMEIKKAYAKDNYDDKDIAKSLKSKATGPSPNKEIAIIMDKINEHRNAITGFGRQQKANEIEAALNTIMDNFFKINSEASIDNFSFKNIEADEIQPLMQALAKHRDIWRKNPIENNTINANKAAKSFNEVRSKLAELGGAIPKHLQGKELPQKIADKQELTNPKQEEPSVTPSINRP